MADELTDAWKLLSGKETVPSGMVTAEWARTPQWVRERSFFMAGVAKADILESFREAAARIAAGETNIPMETLTLQSYLQSIGYKAAPGEEGTIKDLSTSRRIAVSLATNTKLLQGWAKKERGMRDGALRAFPGWELVRIDGRKVPREWRKIWEDAGGTLTADGRMIAHKLDDIWRAIGHEFEDSIGTDYPPFMWGSGMGWRAVSRREMKALGLMGDVPAAREIPGPVSSPNEGLQVADNIRTPSLRAVLGDQLKGLVEFRDDLIVCTDPNGTRPYAAERLAEIVTAPLPDGIAQIQAQAVERHVAAGLMLGDLADDFRRFVARTMPLAANEAVWRGEAYRTAAQVRARLEELTAVSGVSEIAQSWTLDEAAAMAFASGKGLKHRLVLLCRKHGSLKPIYPTAEKLVASAAGQKEIVAATGTRFRMVGSPSVSRSGNVVETRIEVEEVTA